MIDYEKDKIPSLFKNIFIPTVLGMIFNIVFVLTDGIFIGHEIGPEGLAVVNLFQPIFIFITSLGITFGSGCCIRASIHMSRNENEKARRIITDAFSAGIVISILLSIVLYIKPKNILFIIGATENLVSNAYDYYIWFIPTALFLMIQLIGEFVIRQDGSPKFSMYANIIPAIINIILDYILIFPCKMGLIGAAIATDIGTFVGASMTIYYVTVKASKLRLKFSALDNCFISNIISTTKNGFPSFINSITVAIMILMGNLFFGRYLYENGLSAFSIICYIFPILFEIFAAIAYSAQPIISYNHGINNNERIAETFKYSLRITFIFTVLTTLLFVLFPETIITIFVNKNTDVFMIASKGLPLFATGLIFTGYNIITINYFQSIELTRIASYIIVIKSLIILPLAFYIIPLFIHPDVGLWLATPVSEILITPVLHSIKKRYE